MKPNVLPSRPRMKNNVKELACSSSSDSFSGNGSVAGAFGSGFLVGNSFFEALDEFVEKFTDVLESKRMFNMYSALSK